MALSKKWCLIIGENINKTRDVRIYINEKGMTR